MGFASVLQLRLTNIAVAGRSKRRGEVGGQGGSGGSGGRRLFETVCSGNGGAGASGIP